MRYFDKLNTIYCNSYSSNNTDIARSINRLPKCRLICNSLLNIYCSFPCKVSYSNNGY